MHQKHIDREETANLVEFLALDKANYVAGSTVFVDGGMTLYPAFDLSFHPGKKQEDADE